MNRNIGTERKFPLDGVQFVEVSIATNSWIIVILITHWKLEIFHTQSMNETEAK